MIDHVRAATAHHDKWSWIKAFRIYGPHRSTVRLVLFALAAYMDEGGGRCFPSMCRLASDCALTERAVREALKVAVAAGWIMRWPRRRDGRLRNGYAYCASVPATFDRIQVEHGGELDGSPWKDADRYSAIHVPVDSGTVFR